MRRAAPLPALLATVFVGGMLGVPAAADTIRIVPLTTNRIASNPVDGMLYVTTPETGSVTVVDPVAGTIGGSIPVGSGPLQIAISDTGRYVYVGLNPAAAVRRVDTVTQTADLQFSVGVTLRVCYVDDIKVMPGNENVVAIARRNSGLTPRHEGVAIYEGGVMRPTVTPSHTGANVIVWASPAEVYGFNNETTGFQTYRLGVNASGVSIAESRRGLFSEGNFMAAVGTDIKRAGGFLFSTTGRKIDAATLTLAGQFPTTGLVEPDLENGRVFFLATSGSPRLLSVFDMETFLPVGSVSIADIASDAAVTDLIRWGDDGLAFRTNSGQIVLVNTPLVDGDSQGSCCFTDGTCSSATFSVCTADRGVWGGPGSTCGSCPQPGACCMTNGACAFVLQSACAGSWSGAGVTCAAAGCPPAGGGDVVRILPLTTNRLAYNRVDGKVYATVPSVAGAPRGNSLVAINPTTAAVEGSAFLGSEPMQLAVSDTGRYVYAGLWGSGFVRRYDTTTQAAGLHFGLGFTTPSMNYVEDIEVMPGSEGTVAVARRKRGFIPPHEGVAIYDEGVQRPMTSDSSKRTTVIAWSDSPGELFGFDSETSAHQTRRLTVNASGVSIAQSVSGLIGEPCDIKYAGGFIYSTNGHKIDGATLTLADTFPVSGVIEPDPARGRLYVLAASGSPRVLRAYDIDTLVEAGSIDIPGIASVSPVSDLFRWGDDGLVFRTGDNQVVFVNTSLVPPGPTGCYANCDQSTSPPILNVADFTCFLQKFAAGDVYANCDQSTSPPALNVADFTCFLQKFAAACP